MILTCPECATGYFVDDERVAVAGRLVRCTACGARWRALPATPPLEHVPPAPAKPPARAAEARPAPTPPPSAEDLPRAFRDRALEERRLRGAALAGAAWAAGLVVLALLAGAVLLYRGSVVRAWPQTASAYAAIGFPVNPTGLAIEQVQAEPSLEDGHATLAVSGVIRNVLDHDVVAPPLRISLLNAQGRRVAGQIATLANAKIPAGEQRRFATSVFDPPFSAASLQIDFAIGARPTVSPRGGSLARPTSAPPAAALRGPDPETRGGSESNSAPAPA